MDGNNGNCCVVCGRYRGAVSGNDAALCVVSDNYGSGRPVGCNGKILVEMVLVLNL